MANVRPRKSACLRLEKPQGKTELNERECWQQRRAFNDRLPAALPL